MVCTRKNVYVLECNRLTKFRVSMLRYYSSCLDTTISYLQTCTHTHTHTEAYLPYTLLHQHLYDHIYNTDITLEPTQFSCENIVTPPGSSSLSDSVIFCQVKPQTPRYHQIQCIYRYSPLPCTVCIMRVGKKISTHHS